MGRNHAIKGFDPRTRTSQTLDLFTHTDARLPVIVELLKSPWLVRASELASAGAGGAAKRRDRVIEVTWDGSRGAPRFFALEGRGYPIAAVVQSWTIERSWWDPRRSVSRRCFRVLAQGGLYDLAYDRTTDRWLLVGIVD
jgi:hypothetical protein